VLRSLLILLVSVFDSESVKVERSDSWGDGRVGDSKKGLGSYLVSMSDRDGGSSVVGDGGSSVVGDGGDGLSYWVGNLCWSGIGHWRHGFCEDGCRSSVGDGGSNGMMSGI